jgi:hypothetical protein
MRVQTLTQTILGLSLAFSLSACTSGQLNSILPQPSSSPSNTSSNGTQNGQSVFSQALSKRLLPLNTTAQASNQQGDAAAPAGNPAPQVAVGQPTSAESDPANKMAAGASSRMIAPWFGGGEFNQYVIQFAEESIFKANQGTTLLTAYAQTVKPLLAEWDASARLVESRANLGLDGQSDYIEYISLPGVDGKEEQIQPDYVFRFSSSNRKETLNVYLLKKETRVHRLIWGEPTIDLSKVKIDSTQAQDIARKAFTSQSSNPGYPVYPEAQNVQSNMQIAYSIPDNAQWQIQLNQQGQAQNRYFISVSFELKTPNVQASPSTSTQKPIEPGCIEIIPTYPEQMRVWGSVELDAASGEIKNLNRPVLYSQQYDPAFRCVAPPPDVVLPVEPPKPLPVESSTQDQATTGSSQTNK